MASSARLHRLVLDLFPSLYTESFDRYSIGAATCFCTERDLASALEQIRRTFLIDGWQIARVVEALVVTRDEIRDEDTRLFDLAEHKGLYCDVATIARRVAGRARPPFTDDFEALCRDLVEMSQAVVLWSDTDLRPVTLCIDEQDAMPIFRHQRDATIWAPDWRSDCRPRRMPLSAVDRWLHELAFDDVQAALCLGDGLVTFHPASVHEKIVQPHWRAWDVRDQRWGPPD